MAAKVLCTPSHVDGVSCVGWISFDQLVTQSNQIISIYVESKTYIYYVLLILSSSRKRFSTSLIQDQEQLLFHHQEEPDFDTIFATSKTALT